jgi:hypothetical protein
MGRSGRSEAPSFWVREKCADCRACCPTRSWVGRGVPPCRKHPKISEQGGACSLSSSGGEGWGEEAPCSMLWFGQHSSGLRRQSIWHGDGERRPPLPVPLLQRRRGNRQRALPSSSRGTWAIRPAVGGYDLLALRAGTCGAERVGGLTAVLHSPPLRAGDGSRSGAGGRTRPFRNRCQ